MMDKFNIGDIVGISKSNGKLSIGMIKKIEDFLGVNSALVDVLGEGKCWYCLDQLKHVDLRKLLTEE